MGDVRSLDLSRVTVKANGETLTLSFKHHAPVIAGDRRAHLGRIGWAFDIFDRNGEYVYKVGVSSVGYRLFVGGFDAVAPHEPCPSYPCKGTTGRLKLEGSKAKLMGDTLRVEVPLRHFPRVREPFYWRAWTDATQGSSPGVVTFTDSVPDIRRTNTGAPLYPFPDVYAPFPESTR